jgi:peptide/nickel transport system substrate-binding protein
LEADVDEYGIRELIGEVTRGRLSRRQFVVRNDEYDRLWRAAEREMAPFTRAAHFIRMNDLIVQEGVVIPLVLRHETAAVAGRLRGVDITPWGSNLWNLAHWSRA